ncbi:hypothetical protein Pres01_19140 [Metapseudomonas resinovorans]|nr:hypothetical protein Pres01_19140 [Pseudomonas resinovorans]
MQIGCAAQTLHDSISRHQTDNRQRPSLNTEERESIKVLEREHGELRKANEIPRLASAYLPKWRSTAAPNPAGIYRSVP